MKNDDIFIASRHVDISAGVISQTVREPNFQEQI